MDVAGGRAERSRIEAVRPTVNGFPFDGKELVEVVDAVYAAAASAVGLGVIAVRCGEDEMHHSHPELCEDYLLAKRLFSPAEAALSSTHRELLALVVVYTDPALLLKIKGRSIAPLTDNQGAAAIMKVGSPVSSLQAMAIKIFERCRSAGVRLRVHWRARSDPRMAAADARSRHFDNEDWGPDFEGFQAVLAFCTGSPDIDLFATAENARCPRFASKFAAEQGVAVAINAFSINWGRCYFYACPPPRLVIPALRQVAAQAARGVMVVPCWPTARFWPVLVQKGKLSALVTAYKRFRPVCLAGMDVISGTFHGELAFDLLMLELDGDVVDPFAKNLCFN
jgi:hypothetical protein